MSPRPDDNQWLGGFSYVKPGLGPDGQTLEEREPLNLSVAPNSHKRAKRGLKGITSFGKNMTKSVGALMERYYPHHRKTFATLTIPPLSSEKRALLASRWSELVRQLLQWLSRRLAAAAVPTVVCSVTEVQPKRLLASGEGYLHLHMLWLNLPGRAGNWAVDVEGLKAWAWNCVSRLVDEPDLGYLNVNVRPVKGSAARYMAKYMSKGGAVLEDAIADWGTENCPSTWWNMTAQARRWVKCHVLSGEPVGALLETIVNYVFFTHDDSPVEFLRQTEIEFDGVFVTVGWRGRLSPPVGEDLTDMIKSAHTASR